MAQVKRRVRRAGSKEVLLQRYGARRWYQLPDWAVIWLSDQAGWIALIVAVFMAPLAYLGIFLGFHALPLEFLGIPSTANGVGLATSALLIEFILLVLAVRPLWRQRRIGWFLVIAAAIVHWVHSLMLQHAVSGLVLLALVVYVFWQVRQRLE
jgi:hypothetical protein